MASRLRGIGGESSGVVRTPRVNVSDLYSIAIFAPDPDDQRRIADFLDRECDRIADLRKLMNRIADLELEAADALRSDVLQVDAWHSGGTPDSSTTEYWTDEISGVPWVAIGDMSGRRYVGDTARRLTPSGVAAARLKEAPAGTLLLAMYASVGEVTELTESSYFNQALIGIEISDLLDRAFMYEWLCAIRPHLGWFTKSNTQPNLTAWLVQHLPVAPIESGGKRWALERIAAAFRRSSEIRATVDRGSHTLDEYRDALITEAVTGQLDLPRLSDAQLRESAHIASEGARPGVLSA
jgi:hypothetical protein